MIYKINLREEYDIYYVDTYYSSLSPRPVTLHFKTYEQANKYFNEQKRKCVKGE